MAAVPQTICGSAYLDVITLRLVAVMAATHAGSCGSGSAHYGINGTSVFMAVVVVAVPSTAVMAEVHAGQSCELDIHGRSAFWADIARVHVGQCRQ
jgi:hypothetical protein